MNRTSRAAAIINSEHNPFQLRFSLFHSSPVLERRRRTHWDSGGFRDSSKRVNQYSQYSKRFRKQTLLRNVSEFAEHLFQSWQSDSDDYEQSSSQGCSWFRPRFRGDGFKRGKPRNRGPPWRRHFEFCEDDDTEFETIFRSTFSGNPHFYWSFTTADEPRYRNSSDYYRTSSDWRHQYYDEYDSNPSSEFERSKADLASDRLALGLSASGPLNLEDVKTAYRACALKWHPDRHQGSSKVVAEEKFKVCSAAYQSLCDKLTPN